MKHFFSFDGPFQTFLSNLIDVFLASIFFIVFSIPVVTAGAAGAALYDTVRRVLDEERGYLWRTFWHSLKSNFKVATPAWLIHLLLFVILFLDQIIIGSSVSRGSFYSVLYYLAWVFLLLLFVWEAYTYAYVSRFVDTSMTCLKNGLLLLLSNFGWSLLMGLILVGAYLLVMQVSPFFIVILPAVIAWIYVKIIEHVFKKIMPPAASGEESGAGENPSESAQ